MIKYYFVCPDREIFLNLPKEISRDTLRSIKLELSANFVYFIVYRDVKYFLDLN